ncbi:MAG TPA: NAD-dependent epimerase/dehydratase family protein [Kofleriaceae bacterium]|jgi:threonine 3-dehydrogenase|nr:NAD-dependent epimerase/dehydratase family protein [Kofleriaceae bacterium]
MKILLTGAGGQIGHDLIGALVARGHDVVSTDLAPRPPSHAHAGGESWQRLDVTDAAATVALMMEVKPDLVFHLAAILSARGEQDPRLAYDVNQTGTWNVLEACRRAKVRRLVFTSSIAVFGPLPNSSLPDPTPDDIALHPTTMYGVTKVSGELLCEYYRQKFQIDCRGVRFPGLISAAMPGGGSSDYALFMYVDGVRKNGYEAFARADTRIPLMYMPDGVRALLEIAMADRETLTRTIYNIAAFSPRADEIARSVQTVIPGAKFSFKPDPARQSILDSWPKSLDDSAARSDWGWKPTYDLDAMTNDLIPKIRRMLELGAILSSH